MIALFKSHFSIGKSILTLDHPSQVKEGGSDSVFSIIGDKLEKLVLVEDSLIGFLQARKVCSDLDIQLVFGLRIKCSHEEGGATNDCIHKIIIFAKNDDGCKLLNKIYSHSFCENGGVINFKDLKPLWCNESLKLCVPFYDSFIFMNTLHFCTCVPDFSFVSPVFFIENNHLPFDPIIRDQVVKYCEKYNYEYLDSKSIYYNSRSDFDAYQTYKCVCSKKFKQRTLNVPNFDHLSSSEFCLESYLETCNT
jgi:DNA polymerase III alpha subunit